MVLIVEKITLEDIEDFVESQRGAHRKNGFSEMLESLESGELAIVPYYDKTEEKQDGLLSASAVYARLSKVEGFHYTTGRRSVEGYEEPVRVFLITKKPVGSFTWRKSGTKA